MTRRGLLASLLLLLPAARRLPEVEREAYAGDFDSWHRSCHEAILKARDEHAERRRQGLEHGWFSTKCGVCGAIYIAGMWISADDLRRVRAAGAGGDA